MSNDANESDVVDFMWVPGENFVDEFRLEWEESGEAEVFYKEQIKQQLKANAEAKKWKWIMGRELAQIVIIQHKDNHPHLPNLQGILATTILLICKLPQKAITFQNLAKQHD